MEEGKKIVFTFWKGDDFYGFRADTFNTLSQEIGKIYTYSEEQVEIVKNWVKGSMAHGGSRLLDQLFKKASPVAQTVDGKTISLDDASQSTLKHEKTLKDLLEFEMRVYEFPLDYEDYHTERWKWDLEINKIKDQEVEPIEVHKFQTMNSN